MIYVLERGAAESTAETASPLEETLVDILDLSLQADQVHWSVDRSGSKRVHRLLDDLLAQYRLWQDRLSSRVGDPSKDRLATLAATTPLEFLPAGKVRDQDVVAFLEGRFTTVAGRVRARLETAGAHDPAARDLLAAIADGLDKQGWMLRAYLDARLPHAPTGLSGAS
jgi:starvation-inducible DNA-binding protein